MKKIFPRILTLTILLIILMMNTSIAVTGEVNDIGVRIRSGPSTEDTETLTYLYDDDTVEVLEKVGEWYKIKLEDGREGYISEEFLNVSEELPDTKLEEEKPEIDKPETPSSTKPEEPTKPENVVTTFKIKNNISGKYMPLMYSSEKVLFNKGETLKQLDKKAYWIKVTNDKVEAWVLSNLL